MISIVKEYEGLVECRIKTISKKLGYCGFNTAATHLQVQLLTLDGEMSVADMQEDQKDLQPVQPNSIYLKCGLLESASSFVGKGNLSLLAVKRNQAPVMKLANSTKVSPLKHILPTETPIEDEYEPFDLTIQKNIIFYNPSKENEIGWYNRAANILWLSDLVHNPLRTERLLDAAVSAVYELQRCGTLNVITPIQDKFVKEFEKRGMSNVTLWWTGFETHHDTAHLDGIFNDPKKFIDEEFQGLVQAGADVFFLRKLLQLPSIELSVDKDKCTLVLPEEGKSLQIPAHTTLEEQTKAIQSHASEYSKKNAKEFYKLAEEKMKEKRIS